MRWTKKRRDADRWAVRIVAADGDVVELLGCEEACTVSRAVSMYMIDPRRRDADGDPMPVLDGCGRPRLMA